MLGLIYLLLCICVGLSIICLVFKKPLECAEISFGGRSLSISSVYFLFPVSLVSGTLVMSWLTYIFAYLFRSHHNALTYSNWIVMVAAALFVGIVFYIQITKLSEIVNDAIKKLHIKEIIAFVVIFLFITFLMFYTFRIVAGKLYVGVSVFSDFATHLDMIRSFSHGNNFPTTYSHYAGVDIKYHFMFQFLVGNLEYLGLRLDFAFNIPSIMFMFAVCMLLYFLATKLFAKTNIGFIAIALFLFRSGKALWNYLAGINATLPEIIKTANQNTEFIGSTTNENWGLYNLNVYANQRHLSLGLCMILIAVIFMIPNVCELRNRTKNEKGFIARLRMSFISKEGWFIRDIRTCLLVGFMLGLGAFFNGACVIGALMVLFVFAILADRRLEYLILAVISVVFSFIQTSSFINGSVMELRWDPGYLSDIKNIFATTNFYMTLLGVLPLVGLCAFLVINRCYKWIMLAFSLPLLFSATFQMTVDTAVNHKYIMMSVMLLDVFIAGFIYWLFCKKDIYYRIVSILILVAMTATGIYDFTVYVKKNNVDKGGALVFDMHDPTTEWIMNNSDSKDIFLTDWYSLNKIVLGGAMLYYGWPYFAWSAGYDTMEREEQVIAMYQASTREELMKLCEANNIRFIVVDNAARTSSLYRVREDIIAGTYGLVYTDSEGSYADNPFGFWSTNIYDTRIMADSNN